MNNRQLKKLKNRYLNNRDLETRSKNLEKELDEISKNVDDYMDMIEARKPFYDKGFTDVVLNTFVKNNLDKVSFNKRYFNELFNNATEELGRDEFFQLDIDLSDTETPEDFYKLLIDRTTFDIDCFTNIDKTHANSLEVKFTLDYENLMIIDSDDVEEEMNELFNYLGFEFNWFKNPLVILSRYKTGKGKESIKYVVTYLSFFFDTPLEFEENPKKYVNVPYTIGNKKNKQKKVKRVPVKNYEEKLNKRYIFSSVDSKFYDLLSEFTEEIVIDKDFVTFVGKHKYFKEIIFYK